MSTIANLGPHANHLNQLNTALQERLKRLTSLIFYYDKLLLGAEESGKFNMNVNIGFNDATQNFNIVRCKEQIYEIVLNEFGDAITATKKEIEDISRQISEA